MARIPELLENLIFLYKLFFASSPPAHLRNTGYLFNQP